MNGAKPELSNEDYCGVADPYSLRMGGACIYSNGKWDEILPSTPDVTIGSHKVEFREDHIKVGCQDVEEDVLYDLYNSINNFNLGRERYYIDRVVLKSGDIITVSQIREINEYFNK